MKQIIIILSIFFTITGGLAAQDFQNIIDTANSYYSQGNYEQAVELYQQVLESGYEASEIYFNLGNAYFKSNMTTKAIINYERALQLEPSDEDILFNLALSQQYVIDKIEEIPEIFFKSWYRSFIQMFSSNLWAIISLASFVVGLVFFLVYFLVSKIGLKKSGFWLGILLMIISVSSFSFSNKQKEEALSKEIAIITTPSVVVKSSPDESGTDLFVIHEGLKVTVTDNLSEWLEIKLPDGNKGWLKTTDLEII